MGSHPLPPLPILRNIHFADGLLGVEKFFENTEHALHIIQGWKAELFQFGMEIEHRSARMMHECNMLSRYNNIMEEWREQSREDEHKEEADQMVQASTEDIADPAAARVMFGPVMEK